MASINKVLLMGNLTKDPELRYTPQGMAVVNLRLAVNRKYRTKTQEMKEEVCFITVVVWNKQAEACNQYLHKGSPIFVEGMLQSRSWDDASGQKRSVIDVRADRVQFMGQAPSKGAVVGAPSAAIAAEAEDLSQESSTEATWLEESEGDSHEG
ncbi:MAG: single-stranded DNA-binding protein [Candidatus Omnitrophica bacterium]|nr:single-stranded DNA-binding protein [Candidatus Omnitrophota bacterium]